MKSIGKGAFGEVILAKNSISFLRKKIMINCLQSRSSAKHTSRKNHIFRNTLISKSKSWKISPIPTLLDMNNPSQVSSLSRSQWFHCYRHGILRTRQSTHLSSQATWKNFYPQPCTQSYGGSHERTQMYPLKEFHSQRYQVWKCVVEENY